MLFCCERGKDDLNLVQSADDVLWIAAAVSYVLRWTATPCSWCTAVTRSSLLRHVYLGLLPGPALHILASAI